MLDKLYVAYLVKWIASAIKIQRWYRRYRCSNDTDPITLERIRGPAFVLVENPQSSASTTTNHRYKFDPLALYEYFKTSVKFENPLTRRPLLPIENLRLQKLVSKLRKQKFRRSYMSSSASSSSQQQQQRQVPLAGNGGGNGAPRQWFNRLQPQQTRLNEAKMSLLDLYDNARRIKLQRAEDANYKEAEEIAAAMRAGRFANNGNDFNFNGNVDETVIIFDLPPVVFPRHVNNNIGGAANVGAAAAAAAAFANSRVQQMLNHFFRRAR